MQRLLNIELTGYDRENGDLNLCYNVIHFRYSEDTNSEIKAMLKELGFTNIGYCHPRGESWELCNNISFSAEYVQPETAEEMKERTDIISKHVNTTLLACILQDYLLITGLRQDILTSLTVRLSVDTVR
jgi:hypothetical protein